MENGVPKYMTPPKFAEYTGIPLRNVRCLMKNGLLDGFYLNKRGVYILTESYKNLAFPLNTEESHMNAYSNPDLTAEEREIANEAVARMFEKYGITEKGDN